jgi:small-conductance mechanosensitive channel
VAVILTSIKRFLTVFVTLIGIAIVTILVYDLFFQTQPPISGSLFVQKTFGAAIAIAFWAAIVLFIRRNGPLMTKHIGEQASTILQITMAAITTIITAFTVLGTLGTSPESLLTGAGFASITVGLIISTFVGGLLAGALVFTTHKLRVGDTVVFNNVPGQLTELTPLVTRIRTDVGIVTIPNSAISSGTVVITKLQKYEGTPFARLPYEVGDRVVTTLMVGEGTVKSITALRTVLMLDSGRELTVLNSSIFSGSVTVAKIAPPEKEFTKKAE